MLVCLLTCLCVCVCISVRTILLRCLPKRLLRLVLILLFICLPLRSSSSCVCILSRAGVHGGIIAFARKCRTPALCATKKRFSPCHSLPGKATLPVTEHWLRINRRPTLLSCLSLLRESMKTHLHQKNHFKALCPNTISTIPCNTLRTTPY